MIDWVAHWRQTIEARDDQGRRLDPQHGRADAWSGRAERFARYVAETGADDPFLKILLEWVAAHPERSLTALDVGSGPGRHALPLARVTRRVVALEPSAAMRTLLEQNVQGIDNVEVVAERWPDAWEQRLVGPADLVLCAHVLDPVREVEPFVRALDAATRRRCYVALRIGQREGPFLGLFEQVWGEPRSLAPTALDLFNVAHQIGLAARFEIVPFPAWRSYADLEEAVATVRQDILNPPDADEIIQAHLAARLVERDGRLFLPDVDPPRAGVVWWEHGAAAR